MLPGELAVNAACSTFSLLIVSFVLQEPDVRGKKASGRARKSVKTAVQVNEGPSQQTTDNSSVTFSVPIDELISRFTQATNELQLMGIVKAVARKRTGNHVQRLIFGSGFDIVPEVG